MGTLIRTVGSLSQVGYGINILEQLSPTPVQGAASNVVGVVGVWPWGPTNEVQTFYSVGEALNTLAPSAFAGATNAGLFPALLTLLLPWPGPLEIVRIATTGAAQATLALLAGNGTACTVTARYQGSVGNEIKVQITAATNGESTARNLAILIGTTYKAVYENLTADTLAAVSDPYVLITGSVLPDVVAASSLAGGSDGTPAAGDYLGSINSDVGIQLFEGEGPQATVLFCAAVPNGLVGSVNTGLKTFVGATQKGLMAVLCTPAAQSASTTLADVASYNSDRLVYGWPQVYLLNTYVATPTEQLTDGNACIACAMASIPPEQSPGGAGGVTALKSIVRLEQTSPSRGTLDALKSAGVATFFRADSLGGVIIRGAVTTSVDDRKRMIFRRRMADFIAQSIARALERYVELPLDLSFNSQQRPSLGEVTGAEVGVVTTFLEGLRVAGRIEGYQVDPYSQNTLSTAAAGRFHLAIAVGLFGAQEQIVLIHRIGAGENISQ